MHGRQRGGVDGTLEREEGEEWSVWERDCTVGVAGCKLGQTLSFSLLCSPFHSPPSTPPLSSPLLSFHPAPLLFSGFPIKRVCIFLSSPTHTPFPFKKHKSSPSSSCCCERRDYSVCEWLQPLVWLHARARLVSGGRDGGSRGGESRGWMEGGGDGGVGVGGGGWGPLLTQAAMVQFI